MATVKMGKVNITQNSGPKVKSRPDVGPKPTASENPIRVPGKLDKLNRADLSKTFVK
jgi:hypothetical protein